MTLSKEQLDRVILTANRNLADGVIEEPRVFFDEIQLANDGESVYGSADAFRNGEEYPIRIRYMTCAMRYLGAATSPVVVQDERDIQHVGLRFNFHGQDYMRRAFIRAPAWHDVPVAAGPLLTQAQSTMRFDRPFILSSRDSMRVRVQLDVTPTDGTRTTTVAFTGYGLDSRRPYFKAAELDLANTTIRQLNTAFFRNDGNEPIVMTKMTVFCGAESTAQNPQGNIRIARVQINQLGNGTQAEWFQGPSTDITGLLAGPQLCPAVLLGTQAGRSVVHRWPPLVDSPDGGLIWEPGEGLQLECDFPAAQADDQVLIIALIGTIIVS